VHQIDEIDTDHGCVARNSVIKHRSTIVYLARDGFYEFTGQQSIPLGYQAVDIYFFSRVDMSFLRNMSGVVDPVKKLFLWVFPTQGSNGICARQMVFNWIERRWSTTDIECTRVFPLYSPGYTVEDIDRNYENIDAVPISLDSPDWLGGTLTLAYVKPNGAVASATGPSRAATIATGEGELYNRREVHLSGLVPIVDGAPATITVGTRNTLSEIPRFTNAGPVSKDGECSVRVTGRYFRAVLEIAAGLDWKFAIGLDYKSEQENNAVTLRGSKR
jgi:hypothetical protein